MPLDKNSLQAAIKAAFQKAKETPPPDDPSNTEAVQEEILNNLSRELAGAIEAYVHSGDVGGITVTVKDIANMNVIGTGTQTGTVKIL